MTALAKAMEMVFIGTWCVAVGAWLYMARYFLSMWAARFQKKDRHAGYWKKTLGGCAVFVLAVAAGFAAGGIAEYWGGGWR